VLEIAAKLARTLGVAIEPEISGKYRVGDIRHCFADIALARTTLGYEPEQRLEDGMAEIAAWLEGQVAADHVDRAAEELRSRGLTL
jgi:dTDP-L-rhamnose 4-epimerase